MLDVCLLGTGGMMPLPYRWLTSLMMRYEGRGILIDCGEGTQVAMRAKGWTPHGLEVLAFTHYHADHISGLPGLLLTMGNGDRREPLLMVGPKGLERVVSSLRIICPGLPFPIEYRELSGEYVRLDFAGYYLEAFRAHHNVPCYGYSLRIPRKGRFYPEKALELGLPKPMWGLLQKGQSVEWQGRSIEPSQVMGEDRKGLHVLYCTDSRPVEAMSRIGRGADLMILEGMYGDPAQLYKAKEKKHMTMYEAAQVAKEAGAGSLWLTHYSPSMMWPSNYQKDVERIFPNTVVAQDGCSAFLAFEE